MIKLRRMNWRKHTVTMRVRDERNAYRILVRKRGGKRPPGRHRLRLEGINIKAPYQII
jgi:hypothetical protein